MKYHWEVHLHTEGSWVLLENFEDVILTRLSSRNLVIKEESLIGNRTYKIRVEVWRPGGIPGIAELIRTVNVPPFGGWCFASPQTGYALDTLYGECLFFNYGLLTIDWYFQFRIFNHLHSVFCIT